MTTIPAERRFVAVDSDDRSMKIERGPVPETRPGELLIKVSAAGLNRADLLQRKGLYPPPEDASPIMGLEVAGEVIAIGAGVEKWQPGDKVCALTHGGGYADYTVAPASQSLPVPLQMSMEDAAALPEALLTIWHNLYQRCNLQAGERVLIHGGASGIGTLGVAICNTLGSEVYTTAGSDDKCRALEAHGARRAINYKTEDFEQVLTDLKLKNKIDVVLDIAGGDFIQKNINVAAPEGRIVNIAFIRGATAEVNFGPVLVKRLVLTGSTLRAQNFAQKAVMVQEIMEQLYPHLENGKIKPIVDRVFSLEEAEQAQDYMESGQHMGKIILKM